MTTRRPSFLVAILVALTCATPAFAAETSIYDIQYTTTSSGDSPLKGQQVTITGIVTASYEVGYGYILAEGSGPWKAVAVYDIFHGPPAVGDKVRVTGVVNEYFGMTEVDVWYDDPFDVLSSGHQVAATTIAAKDAGKEAYESVLIRVQNASVPQLLSYGEWILADSAGWAICDDLFDYMYFPAVGDHLESVTGIVYYSYGSFKIEPRDTRDIKGNVIPHYALQGHVVTMNDAREVLLNSYVEILGDRIVSIGKKRPASLPVVTVSGLIFPGLIDSHNHPQYNVLDWIPFATLYEHRDEWRDDPIYDQFEVQYDGIIDYGPGQFVDVMKLAEVRAATAGTTMIQGSVVGDSYARQGIGVNNSDRYPSLAYSVTFPLADYMMGEWPFLSATILNRFVIHLSEGTNQVALDEFYAWKDDLGMLDARTSIIHGVALGAAELEAMGTAGANLIWSPMSNVNLYGTTANIPAALSAGVTVALAPDWTESGSRTVLDEMKFAYDYSRTHWNDAISPLQFAEFVTRNAAHALGLENWLGQIAPGYRADLMVIPGSPRQAYRSLLRADPSDVELTVVNGRPIYGHQNLMSRFPFLEDTEPILVGGKQRTLALAVKSDAIKDADKPFSSILEGLKAAYEASFPRICDFLGIE